LVVNNCTIFGLWYFFHSEFKVFMVAWVLSCGNFPNSYHPFLERCKIWYDSSLIAKATITYKGTSGSGTFYFNSEGDFIKFSAMRYMGNDSDAKRHEWVLLVDEHKSFEGIKVPSKMTATWKLDSKDWTWIKLEITDIKYNENASQ